MPAALPQTTAVCRPVIDDAWIQAGLVTTSEDVLPCQQTASAVLAAVLGQRGVRHHICLSAAPGVPLATWVRQEITRFTAARSGISAPMEHLSVADGATLFGGFQSGPDGSPAFQQGALARAGAGWLLIDACALLADEGSAGVLERCLAGRRIVWTAPVSGMPGWVIPPAPQLLDAQIILLGTASDIDALQDQCPGLMTWFGSLVTLDSTSPLDAAHVPGWVSCLERERRLAGLGALPLAAWRSLLRWGAREVESSRRLSLASEHYTDLMREADRYAHLPDPIQHALSLRRQGVAPLENAIRRDVLEGLSMAALGSPAIGSVTALTLVEHHRHSLMLPARITATARQGDGKVIDIEREAELGGSSHTKGVMILSAWLSHSLGSARPFSLTAHLACEQCHDPIDGDSASAAELAALVSAIAQVPLAQHIAVTGAVSQHGDLMAVGGINEKIEGHFRLMRAADRLPAHTDDGPMPTPGIIIPASNLRGLCLDDDVVSAMEAGHYYLYAVPRVEGMLEILAGLPWETDTAAGESLRQKALARLDTFDRSHRDDTGRSHWPRPLRDK
jgi:predicted ATP-dependent protease